MGGATPEVHANLDLGGMTCAACAARIEKRLNRLDGVDASVNYATEQASVRFDPTAVDVADLIAAVERAGYTAQAARAGRDESAVTRQLVRRLLVAAVLGIPVLLLSMIGPLQFDYWQWVCLALATPVVWWCGLPFHSAAVRALRHRTSTMDTLISLGSVAAWGWSAVTVLSPDGRSADVRTSHAFTAQMDNHGTDLYFEVACAVVALMLLGRVIERRGRHRSGEAIRRLARSGATEAAVIRDGVEVRVAPETLAVGDRVVVRPGERVAVDGVVTDGHSAVDTSILTGESVPREVGPGSEVAGGTLNAGGRIVVRATRVGAETALAEVGRLVAQAQRGKAPVQRLADRISAVFVPVVIVLALATLVGWLLSGADAATAFSTAVSVLVIACPCALGLATPTALLVGTGRGAQLGILIRGPEVLESTRTITTVLLDKTGTMTEGVMRVGEVVAAPNAAIDELLAQAGAAEAGSEHPIGKAIAAMAAELGPLAEATDFAATAGVGVRALVGGVRVEVGAPAADGPFPGEAERLEALGQTVVEVQRDGEVVGLIGLVDRPRPTGPEAVAALRRLGVRPVLLSGDRPAAADQVGAELGISEVISGVTPAGKLAEVRRRQGLGEVVAMVGDGVNDAPGLAAADLGIAIGTGADVAREASDLTLVRADPLDIATAIRLSRRTLSTIKANLAWAFGYNVAAIPLAVAGLLSPVIASVAMALSSLLVVGNSLLLRRFTPG